MAEETILESTERTSGREALRKNVQAAIALSGAVRSTLGPKGLDKLLVDDEGRTLVTNDGVTVLETAKVEHPVAKMIISASSTQDKVARDGTTSMVVICAEMLRNAWQLVGQGVHPATISRGYAQAEQNALTYLEGLSIEATRDQILSAVETSLSGKLDKKSLSKLFEKWRINILENRGNLGHMEKDDLYSDIINHLEEHGDDKKLIKQIKSQQKDSYTIETLDGPFGTMRDGDGKVVYFFSDEVDYDASRLVVSTAYHSFVLDEDGEISRNWAEYDPSQLTTKIAGDISVKDL